MFFKKKKEVNIIEDEFKVVRDIIKGIIPEITDSQLTPKTTFEEIGFDSIKFINLVLSLEDFIGKELEEIVADLDLATLKRVEDLVKFIQKVKKQTP